MYNEDYFEYISQKPFDEQLRALCNACENVVRNSYESCRNGIGKENADYYNREAHAQNERVMWLFRHLVEEHEKGGE